MAPQPAKTPQKHVENSNNSIKNVQEGSIEKMRGDNLQFGRLICQADLWYWIKNGAHFEQCSAKEDDKNSKQFQSSLSLLKKFTNLGRNLLVTLFYSCTHFYSVLKWNRKIQNFMRCCKTCSTTFPKLNNNNNNSSTLHAVMSCFQCLTPIWYNYVVNVCLCIAYRF